MKSSSNKIERKVVDTAGRLGSLYDASHDRIVQESSVKCMASPEFEPTAECHVFSGAKTNGFIHLLKDIGFDDTLLQSILLGIVHPSGISSLMNFKETINENTRFLYYSYRNKCEKLNVTQRHAERIVSLPSDIKNATHMITEIIWGFEILCVIQAKDEDSAENIEELFQNISDRLKDCDEPLQLTKNEKHQIKELPTVTVFGSKTCIHSPKTSLLAVLKKIQDWQNDTDAVHVPILYTLYPLNWLYNNRRLPKLHHLTDKDQIHIKEIESTIMNLDNYFHNLIQEYRKFPTTIPSSTIDEPSKGMEAQRSILLSIYEEFQAQLGQLLVEVRRGNRKSNEITEFNRRYTLLRQPALNVFSKEVQQWLTKAYLRETLNEERIVYVKVSDILYHEVTPITYKEINELIIEYYSNQDISVILWYSSDRLKREKSDEWKDIYRELVSERTKGTRLIYIDFSQCPQKLKDFVIRRLSSKSRRRHSRSPSPPLLPRKKRLSRSSSRTKQTPSPPSPTLPRSPSPPPSPAKERPSSSRSRPAKRTPSPTSPVRRRSPSPHPPTRRRSPSPVSPAEERPLSPPSRPVRRTPSPTSPVRKRSPSPTSSRPEKRTPSPSSRKTSKPPSPPSRKASRSPSPTSPVRKSSPSSRPSTGKRSPSSSSPVEERQTSSRSHTVPRTPSPARPPIKTSPSTPPPAIERSSSPSSPTSKKSTSRQSSTERRPQSPPKTEINVLLLGETGVGKSTFINAFVNYLLFDSLEQAEHSEPAVLIPVSFLTTVSNRFKEVTVKFGDTDPNENFEHEGQSVTQQCKSYVFHLNENYLLRLIDTPGMGDTRGLDQDDKNIHHILTYVNNLPHINAICLLLKPNTSRLNIFFRSCIQQLFTYLTPNAYQNIIFCFTNARSTFYTPGDTAPLLKQMLKQEHLDDIPFQKQNTFCFDSESFRYLAARKCDVEFDDYQKEECIHSWTTSVRESIRLLDRILRGEAYNLEKSLSPGKTFLEISMLARPLMEALRLIIYNWKLYEAGLTNQQMTLTSAPVKEQLCTNCAKNTNKPVEPFWIVEYKPVKNNKVKQCSCPFDKQHFLIESTVKHAFISQRLESASDTFPDHLREVLFQCDKLIHYLRQKGLVNEDDDPIGRVLERFLNEEEHISNEKKDEIIINKKVTKTLRIVKQIRQENKERLNASDENLSHEHVYQIIERLKCIPSVEQQLESVKTSRKLKMKASEYPVKLPRNKNKLFFQLMDSLH